MNRLLLILIIFFNAAFCYAQPGYVVTENGDTLRGQLKLMQGHLNAPLAVGLTDANGNVTQGFTVSNCKAFALGNDVYQRATVTMDMSLLTTIDYVVLYQDSMRTATLFLRQLYKGPNISLYKYYNSEENFFNSPNEKKHFFIHDGKEMKELVINYSNMNTRDAPFLNERASRVTRQIRTVYRDQLSQYFDWTKEKKLKRQLDGSEYREDHLVKLIDAINKKWDPAPTE